MPDLRISFKESARITMKEYLGFYDHEDAYVPDGLKDALDELFGPEKIIFEDDQYLVLRLASITEDISNNIVRELYEAFDDPGIDGLLQWEIRDEGDDGYQYVALVIEEDGPDTGCEVFGPFPEQIDAKAFADRAAQVIFDAYEENRINMGPHQGWGIRIGVGPNPDLGMTPEQQLQKALDKIEERATFLYGGNE